MACANPVAVRIPKDKVWDSIHNFSGAVPLLAFPRCPVDFDQLGEVDAPA